MDPSGNRLPIVKMFKLDDDELEHDVEVKIDIDPELKLVQNVTVEIERKIEPNIEIQFVYTPQHEPETDTAIKKVHKNSKDFMEWSSTMGHLANQAHKTGLGPNDLPTVEHVNDLLGKAKQTLEALTRIREFVVDENTARDMANNAHDPRAYAASTTFGTPGDHHPHHDGMHVGDGVAASADKNGGFAVPDTKKRRGVSLHVPPSPLLLFFKSTY
jgi:hypothetical protein